MDCNPFIKLILTRCIHCTRCIRFLREIAGNYSLGMLGRGQFSEIGLYTNNVLVNELSSNIIEFCPVGALTSKSYALSYRNWDFYYTDSIDIMDSFLSSVRIYHDNFKIKRILSSYNFNFDAYWISDKSRYFFDSLKIQRLSFPLKLKKLNVNNLDYKYLHIVVSWKNISNYLFDYININPKKLLIKSFLGDFIDLEAIKNFKLLTNKLGSSLFVNKSELSSLEIKYNDLNFDKEKSYIDNFDNLLYNYDMYIFYNYNLRIENPVFNSKLRQRVVWFNFNNIYIFGTNYNLTYKYYYLGNSTNDFIKFLIGKHWVCNLLLKQNKICFLYGNTIFQDYFFKKNWLIYYSKLICLKNNLFKFNKKELNIIYLSSSLTSISSFDLNFYSNKIDKINLLSNNLLNYYIGINIVNQRSNNFKLYLNKYKHNFYIYQNSFFDNYFNYCNIMLPAYNCFEVDNLFFINIMGLVKQNSKLEVNFEKFVKTNNEAIKFIFKTINFNIEINSLLKITNFLPINTFKKTRKIYEFNIINKFIFNNFLLFKYKNFYLISLNKNFYKCNIYSFYSKQLNLMSNLFFNEKSNFDL